MRILATTAVIAVMGVLAASEFIYVEEIRREFDLNSGRVRVVKQWLWRSDEEVRETWVSKTLGTSQTPSKAEWVVTHHDARELWWGKVHSVCKFRYAPRAAQFLESLADLFTQEAQQVLARGFLNSVQRDHSGTPGSKYMRAFESRIDNEFLSWASKKPADANWVRAFHAIHGFVD